MSTNHTKYMELALREIARLAVVQSSVHATPCVLCGSWITPEKEGR